MNSSLISENIFLLYSAIMGIFVTFIYDLLRIIRRVIPHKNFFVSVEDFFFWVFCAISVFLLMHEESNGTLRWFAVFGAICGMLLYKKTISNHFVKWMAKGIAIVLKTLEKVIRFITKPLVIVGKKGKQAAGYGMSGTKRIKRFVKKKLTVLKKMLKMLLCKQ